MTTTTLLTRLNLHTIVDQQDQIHALELSNDILILDGHAATLSIEGTELRLTTEAGTFCVTTQAFWHAFAGEAAPTDSEAGLLLADSVIRLQALQQVQLLQATFQRVSEQILELGPVPLPSYRLNTFIQQALDVYDGTSETTLLLARVLKQDPETITSWARQIGKHGDHICTPALSSVPESQDESNTSVQQEEQAPSATQQHTDEASSRKTHDDTSNQIAPSGEQGKTNGHVHWTPEMIEQLTTAFYASTAQTVKATVREIAQRFRLPEPSVTAKSYELQLPQKKRAAATHQRESDACQEGD